MRAFRTVARGIATTGVALAVGTAPAVAHTVSSPDHPHGGTTTTSVDDCASYLGARGYAVGDGVRTSCRNAADGSFYGHALCCTGLVGLGVRQDHANAACVVASA
ncbi:hypothetical protein [Umezawaea sp.]|uniref:hypothetical protein n=1 Tax=Umezawaea sp. TaxID=1955258 RepID=UPI002ED425B1